MVRALILLLSFVAATHSQVRLRRTGEHSEDELTVRCGTSKGEFMIKLRPDWSPHGVHRFVELVEDGFFDNSAIFRAVDNFLVQFGIAADVAKGQYWRKKGTIRDDPRVPDKGEGNSGKGGVFPRGGVSFAGSGNHSRTTQLFIAYQDGIAGQGKKGSPKPEDAETHPWEVQIGTVVAGMEVVDSFFKGYGDLKHFNKDGVDPQKLEQEGILYAEKNFPKLDSFTQCKVVTRSTEYKTMPKSAKVRFVNKSGKRLHIFFVERDASGQEHQHHTGHVRDGDNAVHDTYTGHRFIVKDSTTGAVIDDVVVTEPHPEFVYEKEKKEEL